VSLSYEFRTQEDILEAETMIEEKMNKFIEAYQ